MKKSFRYDSYFAEIELLKFTDNGWATVKLYCAGSVWRLGWDGCRVAKNRESDALQKYSPTLKAAVVNQLHQWDQLHSIRIAAHKPPGDQTL